MEQFIPPQLHHHRWNHTNQHHGFGCALLRWCKLGMCAGLMLVAQGCAWLPELHQSPQTPVTAASVLGQVKNQQGYQQQANKPVAEVDARLDMGAWWKRLQVPAIDALVEEVDAHNLQLKAGALRVEQQRLKVLIDGAAKQPQVRASLGVAGRDAENPLRRKREFADSYSAGVNASWQADVFNRVGNTVSAGERQLEATQWDAVALRHTLISEAIRRYVVAAFLQKRQALAEQNVASRERSAKIINTRYQKGVRRTTAAQVAASQEAVLQTQSGLAGLEQARWQQLHALDVLKGGLPKKNTDKDKGDGKAQLTLPDVPPKRVHGVGVPSDLLLRRPDVRAAAAQMQAAQYTALASLASKYPSIGLSGGITGAGGRLSDVLDVNKWVVQLGAELVQTLFDGGKADNTTKRAEKQAEQLALNYAQTVLVAVREVEDALLAERTVQAQLDLFTRRLEAAKRSETIQQRRFERGTGDYLAFLDSQRSRVSAEDALLQAQEDAWLARMNLMLALGGGWTEEEAVLFKNARAEQASRALASTVVGVAGVAGEKAADAASDNSAPNDSASNAPASKTTSTTDSTAQPATAAQSVPVIELDILGENMRN